MAPAGPSEADVVEICQAAAASSSTKGNPVVLSYAELEAVLRKAL